MLKSKIKFARSARKKVSAFSLQPSAFACSAFTLLELLVVIAILGILAGLTVPVIKNFGKSDASLGASRQLLDDVARARQLAISHRTTVYMVFVPPQFWANTIYNTAPILGSWMGSLQPAQKIAATNLADKQFTGYTFVARGAMGDQPGNHPWHYLAPWQTLPDNSFIATNKFAPPGTLLSSSLSPNPLLYSFWNQYYPHSDQNNVYAFNTNLVAIPFPTATNTLFPLYFPCLAFNYLGQLTFDGQNLAPRDEYIPLAKGSVLYARDPASKTFLFNPPSASEIPPGNSTNISYNLVHIDRLTGRAVLEYHKVQ